MNCKDITFTTVPCSHYTKDFGSNVEGEPIVDLKLTKVGAKKVHILTGYDGTQIRILGDQSDFLAVGGQYTLTVHHPTTGDQLTFIDSLGQTADEVHFEIVAGKDGGVFWFRY